MIAFDHPVKSASARRGFRRVAALLCLAATCQITAQSPAPSAPPIAASPLSVEIRAWVPVVIPAGTPTPPGGWSNDRTNFDSPCDLHISAWVGMKPPPRPGDPVTVDFFANTNKLGSRKSVWLAELNPSAHPHGNEAVPMFIRPAQFPGVELVWSNAPPGRYTLTATATFAKKPPAVSSPVIITILPPPPPKTGGPK